MLFAFFLLNDEAVRLYCFSIMGENKSTKHII